MVEKYLQSKGINYKTSQNSSGRQAQFPCPKCGHPTKFGINLETGAYQCFRQNDCGIKGSFTEFKILMGDDPFIENEKKYNIPNVKPERINGTVIDWFAKRKISEKTVKQFRIGLASNGKDIMFPYLKDGKLINVKYRNMNDKKDMRTEKGCQFILFNQDNVKGDTLFITEGEPDCMALYEYGYTGVSVPSGVSNLSWIESDWKYLEKFKKIYIIMDNDPAGQGAVIGMVKRLGEHRCYNVKLPVKDVNDCLLNLVSKEEFDKYINNATGFDIEELKYCDNYIDKIIAYKNNPQKLYGTITGVYGLTKLLKGWRNGEVTVWTGQNGSGKTTFISQEMLHLLEQGKKVCIGSFEMLPELYLLWFIKQATRNENISDYDVESTMTKYAEQLFIINVVDDINRETLTKIIEFGHKKYGIDTFVVDSLAKITLSQFKSEIAEQKSFMSELKLLAVKYLLHIHLIAHPRKQENDDQMPDKTAISGSGNISNLADNVISIHRVSDDAKKRADKSYDALLSVKKNRAHGELGTIGLYFDSRIKRFETEPPVIIEQKQNLGIY